MAAPQLPSKVEYTKRLIFPEREGFRDFEFEFCQVYIGNIYVLLVI